MHILLRENLEGYLSGKLPSGEREKLETHLAGCAECRREWELLRDSAMQLRSLRPPQDVDWDMAPGFYAHVIERIEREREIPFWAMLVDPDFGRRVAFACLMLLALLGAYVAGFQPVDYPSQHRPEAILAGRPDPIPSPQLGPNLQQNRGAVLATLVAGGD